MASSVFREVESFDSACVPLCENKKKKIITLVRFLRGHFWFQAGAELAISKRLTWGSTWVGRFCIAKMLNFLVRQTRDNKLVRAQPPRTWANGEARVQLVQIYIAHQGWTGFRKYSKFHVKSRQLVNERVRVNYISLFVDVLCAWHCRVAWLIQYSPKERHSILRAVPLCEMKTISMCLLNSIAVTSGCNVSSLFEILVWYACCVSYCSFSISSLFQHFLTLLSWISPCS